MEYAHTSQHQNRKEMRIPGREGKCCDAVIRQIERASKSIRADVRDPEKNGGRGSVDLLVKVGGQEYALEHTKVQPFGNRIDLTTLWQTVRDWARQWFPGPLPGPAFYQLYIPLDMHPPGRGRKGRDRMESLRQWIEHNVGVLHERAANRPRSPGHIYIMDEISGRPSDWKCEFVIARSNDGVVPPRKPGTFSVFIDSPEDRESLFIDEFRKSFDRKCPKLAQTKEQSGGVMTVLILEIIEPLFAFDAHICKHLPALLEKCPVPPDDIFLVVPHRVFWQVWVAKRGEVHWPDERLPIPHRGYSDAPWLNHEIRDEWRPLFLDEDDLDDLKPY